MGTVLQSFFEKRTMDSLAEGMPNSVFDAAIRRYTPSSRGKTVGEVIGDVYALLSRRYRSEYFYKNTLFNKLLLRRHDPRTTVSFSELRIGRAKADFVMINGIGQVYEIKTELDNLARLRHQIMEYARAFSFVTVVTCASHLDELRGILPEAIGIIELTPRGALRDLRKTAPMTTALDPGTMFRMLRKSEYEGILLRHFHQLPSADDFHAYRASQSLFSTLGKDVCQQELMRALKRRRAPVKKSMIMEIPAPLRFLLYDGGRPAAAWEALRPVLQEVYDG